MRRLLPCCVGVDVTGYHSFGVAFGGTAFLDFNRLASLAQKGRSVPGLYVEEGNLCLPASKLNWKLKPEVHQHGRSHDG